MKRIKCDLVTAFRKAEEGHKVYTPDEYECYYNGVYLKYSSEDSVPINETALRGKWSYEPKGMSFIEAVKTKKDLRYKNWHNSYVYKCYNGESYELQSYSSKTVRSLEIKEITDESGWYIVEDEQ